MINNNDWAAITTQLNEDMAALQTQFAFMEDTIDTLNGVITQRSQLIADQQRQLQLIYQKLESQTQGSQIQPFDLLHDRPPHY